MSTTPANATVYAVRGQLYNLSGVIKSLATGNAITGGLTTLAATISKSDGNFGATTNAPVEIQTSGVWSLDLTAAEMAFPKLIVNVHSADSNAIFCYIEIRTLNLAQFTGPWSTQTPLAWEQALKDTLYAQGVYGINQTGAQFQCLNEDGSVHFQGVVVQNTTSGSKSALVHP